MSTRCTINFNHGDRIEAKIYRHMDGYPGDVTVPDSGVLADLQQFFVDVEAQTHDTRFTDPSYLAAKFVVWQAMHNAHDSARPLDFLSLGILTKNPGDIDYTYFVNCDTFDTHRRPTVTWRKMY